VEENIFRIANNVLYFADDSDYETALWEILAELRPDLFVNDSSPELSFIED